MTESNNINYFNLRTRKVSLAFIATLITIEIIIVPLLIFMVKNMTAAALAGAALVITVVSYFLVYKGRVKLGNALFILTIETVLILVTYQSPPAEISEALITVFAFSIIIMLPSGILINSYYTIFIALYFAIPFNLYVYNSGDPLLLKRIPLFILSYLFASSLIIFLTNIQNTLFKDVISQKEQTTDALQQVEEIISKVSRLKSEIDLSQENVEGQFSEVSNALNNYREKINSLFSSSLNLSEKILETENNQNVLINEIDSTLKITEKQSRLVEINAEKQKNIFNSISYLKENALQSKEINEELSRIAKEGKSKVSTAVASIKEFDSYQGKMLDIIKLITDISMKTNLLSMNASIEAAHAGESGKGFAVVAGEIRKLAGESNRQTKEIEIVIKDMNSRIGSSIEKIEEVGQLILNIITRIEQSYPVISQIFSSADELFQNNSSLLDDNNQLVNITNSIINSSSKEGEIAGNYSETFNELKIYFNVMLQSVGTLKSYNEQSLSIIENISGLTRENREIGTNINKLLLKEI